MQVRLQKILSTAGVASRRAAEELILEGRVGGQRRSRAHAREQGRSRRRTRSRRRPACPDRHPASLHPAQQAARLRHDAERSGRTPHGDGSAAGVREYVYPVGRLDYDSEGLLLLTSDGDLAARLTHPRHGVARVYEAIVVGRSGRRRAGRAAARACISTATIGARPRPPGVRRGSTIGNGRTQTTKLMITLQRGAQPAGAADVRPDRPPGAPADARAHGPDRAA